MTDPASVILTIDEDWRPIPLFPGYYANGAGQIGSTKRWNKRPEQRFRILKPWTHKSGHLYVGIRDCYGRRKKRQVHHLVMDAFGKERPSRHHEMRHLDGNPTNNSPYNLRWGTRAENIADHVKHTGRHMRATLPQHVADEIRSRFTGRHGERRELAREYGVHECVIGGIVNGNNYNKY